MSLPPIKDATLITSSFGGGWMVPKSELARVSLAEYFGGDPEFFHPIQQEGWLVEPTEIEFLAEHCKEQGLRVAVD
jgi:hypothetical protein